MVLKKKKKLLDFRIFSIKVTANDKGAAHRSVIEAGKTLLLCKASTGETVEGILTIISTQILNKILKKRVEKISKGVSLDNDGML